LSAGELILEAKVADMPWLLEERQGTRFANSGFSQVLQMAEPRWTFNLATKWLTEAEYQDWQAWISRRRGSAITFTAWRMSQPNARVPVVSDVGLTVTAIDRANNTVSFGGATGWQATAGDMVSYYTAAGGYWCGQVLESKNAVGSAMSALKVWPAPFEPHATTANPRRIRALAEFRLRMPIPMQTERKEERFIAFTADQMIRG